MSVRAEILAYLNKHPSARGKVLCTKFGISRQALNAHLQKLIAAGEVVKSGTTRDALYYSAKRAPIRVGFKRSYSLDGLAENEVYERIAAELNLHQLRSNVEAMVHYAFTEMLNNAIDHSHAKRCQVSVQLDTGAVSFEVRDAGIGVFKSIADKFHLADEQTAMIELVKGKTTTQPQAHSGEGLFFTARLADRFVLQSHRTCLEWDRMRKDVFVSENRFTAGTKVQFFIRRDSRTRLDKVFSEYAPEKYDFQFQKTRVHIKLVGKEYISRSEAKRLLNNLEKFKEIELDFKNVKNVGQGFADEVYRVFVARHPGIKMETINANKIIASMIRHVKTEK